MIPILFMFAQPENNLQLENNFYVKGIVEYNKGTYGGKDISSMLYGAGGEIISRTGKWYRKFDFGFCEEYGQAKAKDNSLYPFRGNYMGGEGEIGIIEKYVLSVVIKGYKNSKKIGNITSKRISIDGGIKLGRRIEFGKNRLELNGSYIKTLRGQKQNGKKESFDFEGIGFGIGLGINKMGIERFEYKLDIGMEFGKGIFEKEDIRERIYGKLKKEGKGFLGWEMGVYYLILPNSQENMFRSNFAINIKL